MAANLSNKRHLELYHQAPMSKCTTSKCPNDRPPLQCLQSRVHRSFLNLEPWPFSSVERDHVLGLILFQTDAVPSMEPVVIHSICT